MAVVLLALSVIVGFVDPVLCWEFALVITAWTIGRRMALLVWATWVTTMLVQHGVDGGRLLEAAVVAAVSAAVCAVVAVVPRPLTRLRHACAVLLALFVLSVVTIVVRQWWSGAPAHEGDTPRAIVGVFAMLALGAAIALWREGGHPRPALVVPLAVAAATAFTMLGTAHVLRYRDVDALDSDAARIGAAFIAEHDEDMRVIAAEAEAAESDPLDVTNLVERMRPVLAGHEGITTVALVDIAPDGSTTVVASFDDDGGDRAAAFAAWLITEHDNTGDHHSDQGVADYVDVLVLPDDVGDPATHLVHAATIRQPGAASGTRVLYVSMSVPEFLRAASTPALASSGGAEVTLWLTYEGAPEQVGLVDAVDERGVLVEVPTDDPELVGSSTFSLHTSSFEVFVRPSVGYGLAHTSLRLVLLSQAFVGLAAALLLAQRRINLFAVDDVRRRRQALLDAALAGSRGWSAVIDTEQRVRIANEHPLGTSEGHAVTEAAVVLGDEVAAERVGRLLDDARHHGSASYLHIGADQHGATRLVEMTANVLPATGDERLCFLQFVDVTDDRERSMRAAQAERMEAIGALAGGVAHDFNNLLFIVLGYLQLMEQHAVREHDPKLASYVAPAIDAVQRGAEVTKALLTVSGQHPLNQRVIDIGEFVGELAPLVEQAVGKRVAVTYRLEAGVETTVDVSRLSGSLLNLCANARHALEGRPDPSVCIAVRREASDAGDLVVIDVADNGVGMPAEVVARAFEPFFTTKGRGKGTGLGLASVFSFAQQSGGAADIRSTEGVGTTVSIRLPAASTTVRLDADRSASGPIERALVLDDEKDIADLVASWLEPFVTEVRVAHTPAAVIEMVDTFEPELLVCDAHLESTVDGLEVARQVLQHRPDTIVVFMTGFAERVRELEATGAVTLAKPFSREDFLLQMRRCGALVPEPGEANAVP